MGNLLPPTSRQFRASCNRKDRWRSKPMGIMAVYRVLVYRWKMKKMKR
jgi:hypothetical protein